MTNATATITEENTFDEELDFLDMFVLTFENVVLNLADGWDCEQQEKIEAIKQKLENSFYLMFLDGNDCPNYEQCYEIVQSRLDTMWDEIEYLDFFEIDYDIVYHSTTDTEDIPEECKKQLFTDKGERAFISSLDEQSLIN